jgi:hypothetical protein
MAIMFYPHEDDIQNGTIKEKLDILLEAAERYKSVILDTAAKQAEVAGDGKLSIPREIAHAFNWQEIAKILREIREMPEINQSGRVTKADYLNKLAEIYEVLRGAKMPKLEAVRLALVNEVNQLRRASGASQVA